MTTDPDLQRFIDAQAPIYTQVVQELSLCRKQSHWMWFIFPQLKGLGRSPAADYYGIGSRAETRGYLAHPLLGKRLRQCTALVLKCELPLIEDLFAYPDNLKFHSSMTLFAVQEKAGIFRQALQKYYAGEPDSQTLDIWAQLES